MTGSISGSGEDREPAQAAAGRAGSTWCWWTPARRCLDFLYPPSCASCNASISAPHALCARCWSKMRFIERPYCERLGTPLPVDSSQRLLSPAAIADPPVFNRARAAVCYDDKARSLVHRLKYGDRAELARTMGRMMATSGREILQDADLLIPIPLHHWRLWRRRFNQAVALAMTVAEHSDLDCDPLSLIRTRHTSPQNRLTRSQRRDNLKGAFAVTDEARARLQGKNIVLIDDVLTSGATANAAARTLLRAGAHNVDILTFARVVID